MGQATRSGWEAFPTGSRMTRRAICSSWTRPAAPAPRAGAPYSNIPREPTDPVRRPRPCARRTRSPPVRRLGDPRARRMHPLVGAIKLEEVTSAKPEDVEVQKRTVDGDPPSASASSPKRKTSSSWWSATRGWPGFDGSSARCRTRSRTRCCRTSHRGRRSTARSTILDAGHGGLVSVDGRQLAVYRDDDVEHGRALASLHAHGLHGRLERQREDLGLSVSRVALRRRWIGRARPASEPLELPAARRRPPAALPRHPTPSRPPRRIGARRPRRGSAVRDRRGEPGGRHGGRDAPRRGLRRRPRPDRL